MQADDLAHQNTQHILQGDQEAGGHGDLDAQLAARLPQQLIAEAEAHAQEKDVLAQVLDGGHIELDGHDAAALDDGDDDGEQQAGHYRGGNGKLLQGAAVGYHPTPQENDDGGEAQTAQVFELE